MSAATATAQSRAVRLDVRAPPSARPGERVTVTIDAEAYGGVQNLAFRVSYDRQTLEFVSASPGAFVRQASAPATFYAESPSEGEVLVNMDVKNGGGVAAAGTVVVLEFNALRSGASTITLGDVNYLQSGQSSGSPAAVVTPASIAIE